MPASKPKRSTQPPPQQIDPGWLLKALALSLLAAATLGYLTVCGMIYQGGWQRFLTPSAVVDKTPSTAFETVHFDSAATGQPRLTAWWIPADSPTAPTILFFHDGTGSLSATIPTLTRLHSINLNVFAIDYRGFGQSDPTHPNEARMTEDADAAFNYLVNTRHIAALHIIPYGQGLGAVFAAKLAASETQIPALILDTPDPNAFNRIADDPLSRLLPMRLLLRDHFNLTQSLTGAAQPKLLLANGTDPSDPTRSAENQAFFRTLPDPKFTATFSAHSENSYFTTLHRFLDDNALGANK